MKHLIRLPKEQTQIVLSALTSLEAALQSIRDSNVTMVDETIHHTLFDIVGLKGLFNDTEINIVLSDRQIKDFTTKNGVDLPSYLTEN